MGAPREILDLERYLHFIISPPFYFFSPSVFEHSFLFPFYQQSKSALHSAFEFSYSLPLEMNVSPLQRLVQLYLISSFIPLVVASKSKEVKMTQSPTSMVCKPRDPAVFCFLEWASSVLPNAKIGWLSFLFNFPRK